MQLEPVYLFFKKIVIENLKKKKKPKTWVIDKWRASFV